MERRGGCCIAMYGGDAEAAWRMGRIMLRFRPIAPKPAAGSSEIVSAVAELSPLGRKTRRKSSGARSRGRKNRKVETKPSPYCKDGQKASESSSFVNTTTTCSPRIVTLPLMPEADERRGDMAERQRPSSGSERPLTATGWIGCEAAERAPWLVTAVGSWVTVESVTDTWREWEVAWRSDEAVRTELAADECPGLVSDEWDRVTWTNEAYRRMVAGDGYDEGGGGGGRAEEAVRVGLVVQAAVPAPGVYRAFTCRMRVHYRKRPGRAERTVLSLAAPCDVWRLDDGGTAWRIDVKAALSLSL